MIMLCTWGGENGFLFQKTTYQELTVRLISSRVGNQKTGSAGKKKNMSAWALEPDSPAFNPGVSCALSVFWS